MTTPNGNGVTNRGTTYADGSQVTSTNLNAHIDNAVFNDNAVDDSTIGLNSSTPPALFVKDSGISLGKIADIPDDTILGNVSGGAAAPSALTATQVADLVPGGFNLYRTVEGNTGTGHLRWKNWSANLTSTTALGSWGTSSSLTGTDSSTVFTFSNTGTYLIEFTGNLKDVDTTADRNYSLEFQHTSDGLSWDVIYHVTTAGGSGNVNDDVKVQSGVWDDKTGTFSSRHDAISLSVVLIVDDTSTTRFSLRTIAYSSADISKWEGAGLLKITKLP
jgi:hypothetical protein